MIKEPHYGLDAETTYMKDGKEIELKSPKIRINGKTLEKDKKYNITMLSGVQERKVTSKGKDYSFKSFFAKFTGTDYAFSAEIGDILAKQLIKYGKFTDLILWKEFSEKKSGALVPIVKFEVVEDKFQQVSYKSNADPGEPDDFDYNLWDNFIKAEPKHTKHTWLAYYELVVGSMGEEEEKKAMKVWEDKSKGLGK